MTLSQDEISFTYVKENKEPNDKMAPAALSQVITFFWGYYLLLKDGCAQKKKSKKQNTNNLNAFYFLMLFDSLAEEFIC